ncbi:MAG: GGDEF domain-containing protein, partial [Candidatus Omnitrophota bacterium]|nr:GGDEF domain-containing protein [Candidatus Omnitrophota bacterium]
KTNDTYGHLVGDVILKAMARIMRESVREIDLISRYGGEEFAICLPETGKAGAALVAERIRKKIEENTFRAYDESLKLTVSIGVSACPEDSANPADIIGSADAALYAAKKSGKNIVSEYKG